jgi:hypothetical protein
VADAITTQPPIDADTLETLRARIADRQKAVGYTGDYAAWVK